MNKYRNLQVDRDIRRRCRRS